MAKGKSNNHKVLSPKMPIKPAIMKVSESKVNQETNCARGEYKPKKY
jgi:hypothetical protein